MIEKFSHSDEILNEIPGMKSGRSLYNVLVIFWLLKSILIYVILILDHYYYYNFMI